MEHQYSSIQANFTSEATDQFRARSKELIKSAHLYKPESMGFEDNPHVTILFGLHDANPPLCGMDVVETHPKFNITLGTVSLVKADESGNPFDVVKANIESSDVYALNTALADVCDYTSEFPEYIPHATMAFVHKDTCDHLDGANVMSGISFIVDRLVYSSIDGSRRFLFLAKK